MSSRRKLSYNNKLLDEESVSDHDYLTSVLRVLNGYCKVNLVVPQTNSFYTSDSLLPINAKVRDITLHNKVSNNQMNNTSDSFSHILKNVADLKIDENSDDKELQSSDKTSNDEFKMYSKPFYSDNSNESEKKHNMSLKGKRKKNKMRSDAMLSTSENQASSSSNMHVDQNSTDYFNEYEKEALENNLQSNQEQDLKIKQMKNLKNVMNNIHSSRSSNRNPESETQNENSSTHSQCPLCFLLYPTPDIEAHASECKL